ncbi:MAG: hypothetical protein HY695_02435 [Deltaproteobacteria bacterium]|nr:hypothetical protein [Deltaproteobacteria bacterium]
MTEIVVQFILAGSAGLLMIALLLGRSVKKTRQRAGSVIDLTEAMRGAESINTSFFLSLELVQKNLESLITRANRAEANLRALLPQAEVAKSDQYAKASLFLAEGKDAKDVSQSLKLPLTQVRFIKELQEKLAQKMPHASQQSGVLNRDESQQLGTAAATPWHRPDPEKVAAQANGVGRQ